MVEDYLVLLRAYLKQGGFINTFYMKKDSLKENTIVGYISSIRKYLEALCHALKPAASRKRKAGKIDFFVYFL